MAWCRSWRERRAKCRQASSPIPAVRVCHASPLVGMCSSRWSKNEGYRQTARISLARSLAATPPKRLCPLLPCRTNIAFLPPSSSCSSSSSLRTLDPRACPVLRCCTSPALHSTFPTPPSHIVAPSSTVPQPFLHAPRESYRSSKAVVESRIPLLATLSSSLFSSPTTYQSITSIDRSK